MSEAIVANRSLPRSRAEALGVDPAGVLVWVEALEQHTHPLDQVQGFMLLRHGQVAAEGWWTPYGPQLQHTMWSLSKSFTSTAIGLAVAEGRLTVDDPVLGFFPEDAPAAPSEHLRAMRVRHLLAMNTGHEIDTTDRVFGCGHDNWARAFLALPVERAPGSWFVYNTAATYMLSAIITKLTGQTLLDYLTPRLLEPLGIEKAWWETDPRGIALGGTGLHIVTEDIARFGQLYLQQGLWDGQQLIPAAWVAEATAAHSDNSNNGSTGDWSVGYGYQFWRCQPQGVYRGDGAFGQYCIVLPEQDAVLAMVSGVRDMQVVLDKVWAHLLPALRAEALAEDGAAYAALQARLAGLSLPVVPGEATVEGAPGRSGVVYRLAANTVGLKLAALACGPTGDTLLLGNDQGTHQVALGHGAWVTGTTALRGVDEPVAGCGGWSSPDVYTARVCLCGSELGYELRFEYRGEELLLALEPNVSWTDPSPVIMRGTKL